LIPQSPKLFPICSEENPVKIVQFELINETKMMFTIDKGYYRTSESLGHTVFIFDIEKNDIHTRINPVVHEGPNPLNFCFVNSKIKLLTTN
jgi:hypothetical protein